MSDGIIVLGATQREHDENLAAVLQRLRDCNIRRLNKAKCTFSQSKVTFYGHVFAADGVTPDPQKVEAIVNAAPPSSAKDIMSLLGMAQYVSRFIPNYASVSAPLRKLTHKDVK